MIVSSGIASSIANTCNLVPFLVGAGTSGNACNTPRIFLYLLP